MTSLQEKVVQEKRKARRSLTDQGAADSTSSQVGQQLRALRKARQLSIRALAEDSGLSANTLSLIENGKTSPSVHTLQLLADSLNIPITTFFDHKQPQKRIVYQKTGERQQIIFAEGQIEYLSEGMRGLYSEPFIATLEHGASSGKVPVAQSGHKFIYCLEGHITYTIDNDTYPLAPGDSLIFDASIPHSWQNTATTTSCALFVVCPMEAPEDSPEKRFKL